MAHSDWFDELDEEKRRLLTEREVLRNLQAIVQDADKTPITEVRQSSIHTPTFFAHLARRRAGCSYLYRRAHH